MTPDRAQATVFAFAEQRTATIVAQAALAQRAASATAEAAEFRRRAVEAAATATARAQPAATATTTALPTATGTPVPLPTPTSGPRYTLATGGSGEIQIGGGTASFGFGVGKRPGGKFEGWLIYGSGKGTLRASEFTALDVHQSTAGFWGSGFLSDQPERISVNVTISSGGQGGSGGSFRLVAYGPGGKELFQEGGPVVRGSVSIDRS